MPTTNVNPTATLTTKCLINGLIAYQNKQLIFGRSTLNLTVFSSDNLVLQYLNLRVI